MDPGAVGWLPNLDDEPDGCVVLHELRGMNSTFSPAESEGFKQLFVDVKWRREEDGGWFRDLVQCTPFRSFRLFKHPP
jgi:hypothetical protein